MKYIKLTQGFKAIVDDDDYPRVSKFKWCAKKSAYNWYAVRGAYDSKTKKARIIRMHREILNYDGPKEVHHGKGGTLDNRRENIEVMSKKQNLREMNKRKNADIDEF